MYNLYWVKAHSSELLWKSQCHLFLVSQVLLYTIQMHLKNLAKVTRKIKTYVSILQTLKKLHKKHQSSIKGKQVAI